MNIVMQTDFPDLKLVGRGKVRDIYDLDDKLLTSNIYFNENKIYFDIPNDNYYYKVLDNKISKIIILRIINILKDNLKKEYFLEENSNQNIIIFQLKDNTLKEYLDNVINSLKKDQEFINDYKKYQDKTNSEIYLELDNYKEIIINNLKSLNIKTIINNKEVEEIKITLDILNYGNINIELIDDLISIYNQEYKIILKENESYNPFNNIDFSITIDINTLNEDEINIIKNKLINK